MSIPINAHKIFMANDIRCNLKTVSKRLSSLKVSEFVTRKLFDPSVHLLNRKSKLLRPALVLMGASAIGENPSDFIDLAVAAELMHTSSLIHDDIVDGDKVRRGVQSVHVKYGTAVALLAGDALISKAVSLSAQYGKYVLMSMTKASMDMCAGEVLDYKYQDTGSAPDLDEYLRVSFLKSASLIGACWSAAAVYKRSKRAEDFYESGTDIGIAFQIRDDILDFIIAEEKHSNRGLIPNIVTSLEKEYRIGKYSALIKAIKLNNQYVKKAEERISGTRAYKMLNDYAELVKVHL